VSATAATLSGPTADVLPPHDGTTEAAALGCIVDASTPEKARERLAELVEADLYDHRHRIIYAALLSLRNNGKALDVPSVYGFLRDCATLDEAGGLVYVTTLPDKALSPAQWPSWLDAVRDLRRRREDLAESVRLRARALAGAKAETVDGAPDGAEFARLATLPRMEYERCREAESKRLGIRVATLDSEVAKRRAIEAPSAAVLDLLPQREPEPWPDEVDGALLLNELVTTLNRFAVFASHAADALALFVLATYAAECFDAAPYVHLRSPEKRCGKSLVMRLLSKLCARALPAGPCSESAIFRAIAAVTPTLLIDEVDTFFAERHELRGILNVGCIRDDAHVMRTEETTRNGSREFVPRRYSVFCPKVFSGIGKLADTLEDRCIVITMKRKRADERRERFRRRKFDAEPLRQKCRRWTADHGNKLAAIEPNLPEQLNDRAADLWEPLLAVADLAGPCWPERARAAAVALSGETENDMPGSLGCLLLADMRTAFAAAKADRLASADLCDRLAAMEERPWSEVHHGKPINPNRLSRLLAPYGVASRKVRLPEGTRQGYTADDLADAWQRYLPSETPSKWNNGTQPVNIGGNAIFKPEQAHACSTSETSTKPNEDAACSIVPPQEPETEAMLLL
jgi:hypothetical protein